MHKYYFSTHSTLRRINRTNNQRRATQVRYVRDYTVIIVVPNVQVRLLVEALQRLNNGNQFLPFLHCYLNLVLATLPLMYYCAALFLFILSFRNCCLYNYDDYTFLHYALQYMHHMLIDILPRMLRERNTSSVRHWVLREIGKRLGYVSVLNRFLASSVA